MFSYLRTFSLVSFLAVLVIAGLIGIYFRSLASDDLEIMAERSGRLMAESFSATVWKAHRPQLMRAPLAAPPSEEGQATFKTATDSFFSALAKPWVVLYDASGKKLYATAPSAAKATAISADIADLRKKSADARSEILHDVSAPDGNEAKQVYVRSLIALPNHAYPQLYAEVYTNITPQWQRILVMQWVTSGGMVTVFFILLWILVLTSRKAEEIITRQHEQNTELAAAAASAQAENQAKSQFLANISHELRTPLNAIIGFSEIIKNELGHTQNTLLTQYQGYINDIHGSGVHLLSLINDILDFSKAEAGKLELEIAEVNLNKTILNCLRLVSPRAESAEVQLIDALPKETLSLATDGKKFKQVMLNLLSNAVKFTPAGGSVTVSAWKDVEADGITFEVRDTGIGIAPKDISRAMAPFGQVDNTLSRKYEGTGLGLPLTKKFVELMGGKFNILSEIGKGTAIQFTLPREFRSTGEVPVRYVA